MPRKPRSLPGTWLLNEIALRNDAAIGGDKDFLFLRKITKITHALLAMELVTGIISIFTLKSPQIPYAEPGGLQIPYPKFSLPAASLFC